MTWVEIVSAMTNAFEDAMEVIRSMPVARDGFEAATDLGDLVRDFGERAARLRAGQVQRIRDEEELSLAALAERIGVSPQRAHQLVTATRPKEGRNDG